MPPASGIRCRTHDVVIVGAGLAGLSAACRLRGAGATVMVLEAAGEVGGRTRSRPLEGDVVELGGEWVGSQHRHLLALMRQLGIATRPARQICFPILWRGPTGTRLLVPRVPVGELAAVPRVVWQAASLARLIAPDEPWRSEAAAELDRVSFGQWLRQRGIRRDGYYFFDQIIGALSSTPIERLSLLHLLWWIRRGAGPLKMLGTTFERNIPAGSQTIARSLADRLEHCVLLGAPVTAITQSSDQVVLETASQERFAARRAIVTAPPGTLQRIAFDPPLPPELAVLEELKIGPGTKVVAHLPHAPVPAHRMFVGGRLLAGGWRVGTRITGFAPSSVGEGADENLIADLAQGFGAVPSDLRSPTIYRWSEHPFLPGCDVGFAPGQLTRHGPHLRQPHGHVLFAGAERSSWPNNMEGAVESGILVAEHITHQLSS